MARLQTSLIVFALASLAVLNGCSGSTKASGPTSAASAAAQTAAPVATTEVITFVPPPPSDTAIDGGCFAPSIAVTRPGVFRCLTGNQIHDPCFQAPASRVVCVADPTKPGGAVTVNAGDSLQQVTPFPAQATSHVWAMETSDGVVCTFFQGATGAVNGERLNYGCADKSSIIGDPRQGPAWTASRVVLQGGLPQAGTAVPVFEVRLTKVWR